MYIIMMCYGVILRSQSFVSQGGNAKEGGDAVISLCGLTCNFPPFSYCLSILMISTMICLVYQGAVDSFLVLISVVFLFYIFHSSDSLFDGYLLSLLRLVLHFLNEEN